MPAKKDVASSSAAGRGKKVVRASISVRQSASEKPTKLLNEREFRERFRISNGMTL